VPVSDIASLRRTYARATLSERDVLPDPIAQFTLWFGHAKQAEIAEPNGMALATVGANGRPSVRIVLLKGVDERGFVFFTDYRSRKGGELAANGQAALCFWWGEIERQVRIVGTTAMIPREESAEYFASRPRGSQLGAWSSHQSSVLGSRDELDASVAAVHARFGEGPVDLPPHWGGYRVVPSELEFWQGRPDRLHDRVRYTRTSSGWAVARLSP
jgi:pyridoxamine 5'-phosphate oxidase